ncbi:MAG TPA: hypothetical protein VK213_03565 [Bacteroidales bacterium]|nr:hypothetical protein [Bacteroidales bacterium]
MKKNLNNQQQFLRLFFLLVVIALMMPAVAQAQSGKPNFAGTWAMNAEKSQMGQGGQGFGGGRMNSGNMVVSQDANTLTVERTRPGRDGGNPVTTTLKYTLDGKESVNASQMGDSKSVATWSPDGKSLKIVTTRSFNGNAMTSTEEWSMNGANLSIKNTATTPNGDMTTVMVYDKK